MSIKKDKKNKNETVKIEHKKRRTVIEINLGKPLIISIIIGVIITTITTTKVITTSIMGIQGSESLAGNEEEDSNVNWIESTYINENGEAVVDVDSDGNTIKVPVPKGYTASKIPGETSVNGGFVIYEGDIDWSTILVDTASETTNESEINTNSETIDEIADQETVNQVTSKTIDKTTKGTTNETVNEEETINEITSNTTNEIVNETTNEITNQSSSTKQENTENQIINENNTRVEENNAKQVYDINQEEEINQENVVENEIASGTNETEEIIETQTNSANEVTNTTNNIETNAIKDLDENINEITEEINTTSEESSIEVLADGDEEITQTDINIFNLQKTTNQYVWVPVKDVSRIYGVDSNGMIWGKLYNFPATVTESRTPLNWSETKGIMSLTDKTSNREPGVIPIFFDEGYWTFFGDTDSTLQNQLDGKTQYELLSKELEENFYATIKSIQTYGGFYIGRYETGGLNGTAVVRKMDTNISSQTWYTMYEKTKQLKGENENVMTSMIWGSLWDETLQWLVDSKATISDGTILTYELINNSTTWGNYLNATFNYIQLGSTTPEETQTKVAGTDFNSGTIIPAGSSDYTKVNNIYDLAGNVSDWTLEAISEVESEAAKGRVYRGDDCTTNGNNTSLATHYSFNIPSYYINGYTRIPFSTFN